MLFVVVLPSLRYKNEMEAENAAEESWSAREAIFEEQKIRQVSRWYLIEKVNLAE